MLGPREPSGSNRVERAPAATKRPWTLQITTPDDGSAALMGRQYMLAAGFALWVVMLGAVSYLASRATSKELAVARLHAVSHEFRTPLSSICQISELLNEDRLPSEEQRRRSFAILGGGSARLRSLVEGLLDFARMPPELIVRVRAQPRRRCARAGSLVLSLFAERRDAD